jgi:hypothetical protein
MSKNEFFSTYRRSQAVFSLYWFSEEGLKGFRDPFNERLAKSVPCEMDEIN